MRRQGALIPILGMHVAVCLTAVCGASIAHPKRFACGMKVTIDGPAAPRAACLQSAPRSLEI